VRRPPTVPRPILRECVRPGSSGALSGASRRRGRATRPPAGAPGTDPRRERSPARRQSPATATQPTWAKPESGCFGAPVLRRVCAVPTANLFRATVFGALSEAWVTRGHRLARMVDPRAQTRCGGFRRLELVRAPPGAERARAAGPQCRGSGCSGPLDKGDSEVIHVGTPPTTASTWCGPVPAGGVGRTGRRLARAML
jgi:hypothetical protein